jgi:hypothetical protein
MRSTTRSWKVVAGGGVAVGALGRGWGPWEAADAGSLVLAALQGDVRLLAKAWDAVRHRQIALRADIIAELGRRSTDERAHMRLLAAANGLLVEAIDLAEPAAGEPVTAGSIWLLNTIPFEEPAPLQREERWCGARVVDALPGATGQRCRVEVVEGPLVARRLEVPRAALRTADEVLGADRLLSDQHETALQSLERGDDNADASRRQARTWLRLIERTADQLATAREVMLFHEALAEQAQHDRDVLRVVVSEGRIEGELAAASEARARSGELLFALQGHAGDLVRALRRATDLDEAERLVRWNMAEGEAGRGARRAMLREERMDAPALRADRAVLAKAAELESSAVARESNPPTTEERGGSGAQGAGDHGAPRQGRPSTVGEPAAHAQPHRAARRARLGAGGAARGAGPEPRSRSSTRSAACAGAPGSDGARAQSDGERGRRGVVIESGAGTVREVRVGVAARPRARGPVPGVRRQGGDVVQEALGAQGHEPAPRPRCSRARGGRARAVCRLALAGPAVAGGSAAPVSLSCASATCAAMLCRGGGVADPDRVRHLPPTAPARAGCEPGHLRAVLAERAHQVRHRGAARAP